MKKYKITDKYIAMMRESFGMINQNNSSCKQQYGICEMCPICRVETLLYIQDEKNTEDKINKIIRSIDYICYGDTWYTKFVLKNGVDFKIYTDINTLIRYGLIEDYGICRL